MGILLELCWNKLEKFVLDVAHGLALGQSSAVGHTEDVGVHGDGGLSERGVEHHIGGFSTHAWKCLKRGSITRHLCVMFLDQDLAAGDDVSRLGVEQADGGDMALETFFAEIEDSLRGIGDREQATSGLVDADIGGLGREDHGNEQFEWRGVDELGGGPGVVIAKAREKLDDVFALHVLVAYFPSAD